jgi:hypothetical protein
MKTIKIILLFAGLSFFYTFLNAQSTVSYAYDHAGNRIGRTIVLPTQEMRASAEEEPTVYSEVLSDILIKIYPNPTQGLLYIRIENLPPDVKAQVALYHLSGKMITVREDVSHSIEIDFTGQEAGIYLLKIVAGENQTEWKIIKK